MFYTLRYPLALFAAVLVSCIPLAAGAYYNPGEPSGFVNDFADIIPAESEQQLENRLQQFQNETTNEIAVVTIERLDGDTIDNFAVRLFEEWGIGTSENDNGVLLLVAKQDKKMRIEVGYGLEGALTDAESGAIIRSVLRPAFQNGRYADGIAQAVDAMMAATQGEYDAPAASANTGGMDWDFIVIFGGFFIIWLAAILGRSRSWWAGGVIGAVIAIGIGLWLGFVWWGIVSLVLLVPGGLLFDYGVSKQFHNAKSGGRRPPWWGGGMWGPGSGGFGSGGFGGFGGGMSGGGGASGGW